MSSTILGYSEKSQGEWGGDLRFDWAGFTIHISLPVKL
jgi:hypothetical protein